MFKKYISTLFVLCLVFLMCSAFVFLPAVPAVEKASLPPLDLSSVLVTWASLSGVALLITALVNMGKTAGVVKDDYASNWSAGLNLLVLIGVIVLQVLGKTNLVPAIDSQAGTVANILVAVTGLVYQIFLSRKAHTEVLSGLPLVGTSKSGRVAGESSYILSPENVTQG